MKQEPVGLFRQTEFGWEQFLPTSDNHNGIPLYTEPQYRELSDEEIWEIWNKNGIGVPYEFARAILKKASEK